MVLHAVLVTVYPSGIASGLFERFCMRFSWWFMLVILHVVYVSGLCMRFCKWFMLLFLHVVFVSGLC